jgi:hypothetical protein
MEVQVKIEGGTGIGWLSRYQTMRSSILIGSSRTRIPVAW